MGDDSHSNELKPLSLTSLISISQTLAGLVRSVLGPCAEQTLLSTQTGRVLVTRDGWTVLSSLHLAHPAALVIIKSLQTYHSLHQDGSKTFIIYLSAMLKALGHRMRDDPGKEIVCRIKMAQELNQFLHCDFSNIVKIVLNNVRMCQKLNTVVINRSCELTRCDVVARLKLILQTSLSTCLQRQLVLHFTDLLSSFVQLDSCSLEATCKKINIILQNFEMCLSKIKTQPQLKSMVCRGILLEGDVQPMFASQAAGGKVSKAIVLININFENISGTKSSILLKPSNESLTNFFTYKRQCFRWFLDQLKSVGVSAIFYADVLPQFASAMCQDDGIYTFYLPVERIQFLSLITGVPVFTSLSLDLCHENVSVAVFSAYLGSIVRIENKLYTVIQLEKSHCSPISDVNHLVVCAPTEGMCDQLYKTVYKTLKVLHTCLKPVRSGDNVNIILSENVSRHKERCGTNNCYLDNNYTSLICMNDGQANTTIEHASVHLDCNDDGFLRLGKSTKSVSDGVNLNAADVIRDSGYECSLTVPQMNVNSPVFSSLLSDSCLCTPSGGGFETALFVAIGDYFAMSSSGDFCAMSSSTRRIIGSLVQEMLAAVPETLHHNLCSDLPRGRRQFTAAWLNMVLAVQNGQTCGFDARAELCFEPDGLGLEPLESKLSLVSHVLQLVVQLLRIDAVVAVTRLPNQSAFSSSETDSDSDTDGEVKNLTTRSGEIKS